MPLLPKVFGKLKFKEKYMNLKDIEKYENTKSKSTTSIMLNLFGAFISMCVIIYFGIDLMGGIEFKLLEPESTISLLNGENIFSSKNDILLKGLGCLGVIIAVFFLVKNFNQN